ncbi:MAG: hypothetical protein KDJ86_12785 [Bauldia sp.]|uniref:hypothetical protein n=1 Tax=Bauldia sp. TaxID=2575872 RepID=UPI001D20E555|nr:hypothetical protein [Bauldia sp.]MCB1486428.1 hypothetical protein [Bauldia sp.]MCB1496657.1 hypothetical protein [Bauldia sp.]
MFRLLLVVIVVALALPLLLEGTMSPCEALERRLAQAQARNAGAPGLSDLLSPSTPEVSGTGMASATVARHYPDLPEPAACYLVYYETYYHSIVGG